MIVVERMDERPLDPGERAALEPFPAGVPRGLDDPRAERAHTRDLRLRRQFDRDDRARHAGLARSVCDALTRVARADRPDSKRAFLGIEHRDRIGRSAQLERVDRLQVFQLEEDSRPGRPLQLEQWRPHGRPGNARSSRFDCVDGDRRDRRV
jgi:hypothetical protein